MTAAAEPLVYADSSALVKLVIEEPETDALWDALEGVTVAASAVARVEVTRAAACARTRADARRRAREVLDACLLVAVTDDVIAAATRLASPALRSLDAIHLASALRVEPDALVVYDVRLAAAAAAHGLPVLAPR